MNIISRSDYRNELAQERANALTNQSVAARMKQVTDSAMAGLRTELLALAGGLSLDAIDEAEKQIIACFGPEGAYRDFITDITHDIAGAAVGGRLMEAAE